jgi:membrane protease subunit HflC
MIKERNQIAQAFRSHGEGKKAEWLGKLENEQRSLLSAAYEKAERIKGTADAEATAIYAEAYGRDADFYAFVKSLETYERSVDARTTFVLGTDSELLKYLRTPR